MPRTKQFDKEQVMHRAMELFWKKGYHNTSVQDLVNHLGINRASLYDTYGDKYALFLASLQSYQSTNSQDLRKIISESGDIKTFLRSFLTHMAERASGGESKGCFLVNSSIDMSEDEATCKIVKNNLESLMEVFTSFFEKAQAEGQLTAKKDAASLAIFFINVINGINITAQSGSDPEMIHKLIETSLETFD